MNPYEKGEFTDIDELAFLLWLKTNKLVTCAIILEDVPVTRHLLPCKLLRSLLLVV